MNPQSIENENPLRWAMSPGWAKQNGSTRLCKRHRSGRPSPKAVARFGGRGAKSVVLRGHEGYILAAAFSPDGTRVVTSAMDRTVRVWNANTGAELLAITLEYESRIARFSPDGTRFVTSSGGGARLWDAANGAQVGVFDAPSPYAHPEDVVFSADGTRIVTARDALRVWDVASGALLAELADPAPRESTEVESVTGGLNGACCLSISADGTRVFARFRGEAPVLWNIAPSAPRDEQAIWLPRVEGRIYEVAPFSPDGAPRLLSGSSGVSARLLTLSSNQPRITRQRPPMAASAGGVAAVDGREDGARFIADDVEGGHGLWDARSGRRLAYIGRMISNGNGMRGFSADGSRVSGVDSAGVVRVFDTESGEELGALSGQSPDDAHVLVFGRNNELAALLSGNNARVWEVSSGQELATFAGHRAMTVGAAFSPNGAELVTASPDQTVRVWNITSRTERLVLRGHEDSVISARSIGAS